MSTYSKGLLALGAAMLLVVSGVAFANGRNDDMYHHGWAMRGRQMMMFQPEMFLSDLNLTPQQRDQVKTILSNNKAQSQIVMKENAEARKALGDDIFNGADQAKLQEAFDKVKDAGWDAVLLRSKIWNEIRHQNILTQDQMATLQKRQDRMDQHMQNFVNRMNEQASGK
jgi:Spy/CpxP family protein refolding chaperone